MLLIQITFCAFSEQYYFAAVLYERTAQSLPFLKNQSHFERAYHHRANDVAAHRFVQQNKTNDLWFIMLGTGIATVFITWIAIRQGLLPLRGLSSSMREIETSHLHVRVDTAKASIELQELTQSFNNMIGRLEEGFGRLSHFTSDIAHELRTPLTNLITQTQVTLSKHREVDTYKELIYSNLEELERLTRVFTFLRNIYPSYLIDFTGSTHLANNKVREQDLGWQSPSPLLNHTEVVYLFIRITMPSLSPPYFPFNIKAKTLYHPNNIRL